MELLGVVGVFLVMGTASALLAVAGWRRSIALLALQYVGVFLIIVPLWPLGMALTRLAAGWMSAAVLGMALLGHAQPSSQSTESRLPIYEQDEGGTSTSHPPAPGMLFHVLVAILALLLAISQAWRLTGMPPFITPFSAAGGLVLLTLGLAKVVLQEAPLATSLGLLTCLGGFEVLLASLSASPLSGILTSALTLSVALGGAYLLLSGGMESEA